MNNLKIGLLYLSLHNQLKKKYGINTVISKKDFYIKIGKHGQIPKRLGVIVIKEMQEKNLIEIISRDTIRILSCDIDIENNVGELYRLAGIYD